MQDLIPILKELTKTQYGAALRMYLDQKFDELGKVEDIEGEINLEAVKKARKILNDIFKFYEVQVPVDKKKNQYL